MTETTIAPVADTPAEPADKNTKSVFAWLEFLTKNFAVISALASGMAVALSLAYLISYLSLFDWKLIWLIEFGDISKFILINVALIMGATASISALQEPIEAYLKGGWKSPVVRMTMTLPLGAPSF